MASPAAPRRQTMTRQRLDLDPSRLTTFPMPGFMESSSFQTQKEPPRSERPSSHIEPAARNVPAPPHSTGNQQYWMPDHLCKACYDCEVPFSFFRRRHHCRLCGMIFCFECSDQFIDGTAHGHSGQIRVCSFCARFVADVERNVAAQPLRESLGRSSSLGSTSAASAAAATAATSTTAPLAGTHRASDVDTVSPLLCIPTTTLAVDTTDATSTLTSLDSFLSVGSAANASFLDSPDAAERDHLSALPPRFTLETSEPMDASDELPDRLVQQSFRPRPQHRRRRSSRELLGAIESGGLLESEIQQLKAAQAAAAASGDGANQADAPVSIRRPSASAQSTQRELGLDKYMHDAHDTIRASIVQAVQTAALRLSATQPVDHARLQASLEDIAFVVAGHLLASLRFRSPNGFNASRLVKVKSIAAAATVQTNAKQQEQHTGGVHFQWLAGTLCRKHLSHKQMARQVANPRILLFACGISYDRSAGAGRLNSLDTLLEQERSYMSILVDKITALEPDVIFVERTVSRHAQELLRARRVGIVLNVKYAILERISRHTGAALLTSVDHVDKARADEVVGTCRSFYVKTIPVVPDDEAQDDSSGGNGAAPAAASGVKPLTRLNGPSRLGRLVPQALVSSRPKTETYLYIDGCDPLSGCTVLLTGPSKRELRVVKRLTRRMLFMTYRVLLEAHVLSELSLHGHAFTRSASDGATDDAASDEATGDTTWYTTCTLRVRESTSTAIRYHPCTGCKYFGIDAYSDEDISVGSFLTQEMAALLLKCQSPKCSYPMADHVQTFSCRTGTITVSFEELPLERRLPISKSLSQTNDTIDAAVVAAGGVGSNSSEPVPQQQQSSSALMKKLLGRDINVMAMLTGIYDPSALDSATAGATPAATPQARASESSDPPIVFWRWCCACNAMVTPFIPLESHIYKYSFARFLELLFLDATVLATATETAQCPHASLASHALFFNVGDWVARFDVVLTVPLRLSTPQLSADASRRGVSSGDQSIVTHVVTKRLGDMKQLLDALIQLFTDKVQGIKQAVEAFERADDSLQVQIVLEVVCLKKLIACDQRVFLHRLEKLDASAVASLAEVDAAQRALYLLACRWIDRMLKLRKLIKQNLSTEATAAMASSSFTLAGFSFSTPTVLSPIVSPRSRDESSFAPSAISRDASDGGWDKRALSDGLSSINGGDASPESSSVSSSAATTASSAESSKRLSASQSFERSNSKPSDAKDSSQSSWRTALWDLYRVLGRNAPGSDFQVDLPEALLAGHPSLPYRSGDNVVLVNNSEPITCVAYALSSDLYDEQLDSWKLLLHNEVAAAVAPKMANHASSANAAAAPAVVQTNWSRAALETTTLSAPFKYSISERPLHVSLLSGGDASSQGSPWEFSTIAYYPLQFEVLRELFYGPLDSFLFSIAHVQAWDANGGKSGASFYRTLDDRFVIKHISSTELQSFLDVLPGYFKYMSSVYFDGRASVISKTVGLYQTMITKRESGQKTVQYISVMENVFAHKRIARTYDLKGSSRNRYIKPTDVTCKRVLLDGNLLESARGHPLGVLAEGHARLLDAVQHDAVFLNAINIVDYSMVVGLSESDAATDSDGASSTEMTVGIIDYYRQFDLLKRVESVSKSVGMIAGQSSPTIIEPALYGKRFADAISRYFMPVSPVSSSANPESSSSRRSEAP